MRHRILQLCKEPLLHFLIVGAMLFFFTRDADSELEVDPPRRIVVDEDALENFLRFRKQPRFTESSEHPAGRLSPEELKIAVDALVRDEALYREAKALGLDQTDYGARQRLIAQLEFINEEVVASSIELTEERLKEQLAHNADRYRVPETITFTHVFFDNQRRGQTGAKNQAEIKLAELNAADGAVPFHEAPMHGDRFLYRQNYANQDETLIASHFGAEAQRKLFSLEVNDAKWQGPIESDYGVHLILLTNRNDSFVPEFEELRPRLMADVYRQRLAEEVKKLESAVIKNYQVEFDVKVRERLQSGERAE